MTRYYFVQNNLYNLRLYYAKIFMQIDHIYTKIYYYVLFLYSFDSLYVNFSEILLSNLFMFTFQYINYFLLNCFHYIIIIMSSLCYDY